MYPKKYMNLFILIGMYVFICRQEMYVPLYPKEFKYVCTTRNYVPDTYKFMYLRVP